MKAYFTFFRMQLLGGLQYRAAAWAGIFTQFFWGFMETQLYRALYRGGADRFPMELSALVSYIWLRQAFFAMLNTWTFENQLFETIRSGDVAYELCRPVSLYGMWFARNAALRVSRAALRCGPILVVSALLPAPWGLSAPASLGAFLCFLLSLILCLAVTVAFSLVVYFSCFYTVSADGLRSILTPVSDLLSGALVPLPFMPDALARVLSYSPFGAMLNAPLRIYSGDLSGPGALGAMALQVFWLTAVGALGLYMSKRGLKKVRLQGG